MMESSTIIIPLWHISPTGTNSSALSSDIDTVEPGEFREGKTVYLTLCLIILLIILLLAFIGNIMVLYVLVRYLHFKTMTNVFLACLSASDLLAASVCMPMSFMALLFKDLLQNDAACTVNSFVNSVVGIISTLMQACIAVDRYRILVQAHKDDEGQMKHATSAILLTVLLALTLSFPWAQLLSPTMPLNALHYMHCFDTFHLGIHNAGTGYKILVLSVCYLIPCATVAFCCLKLWRVVREADIKVKPVSPQPHHLHLSTEFRTAKTVLLMVLSFFLLRSPYILTCLALGVFRQVITVQWDSVLMLMFWANAASNPILYAFRNPNFLRLVTNQEDYRDKCERTPRDGTGDQRTVAVKQYRVSDVVLSNNFIEQTNDYIDHTIYHVFEATNEVADRSTCLSQSNAFLDVPALARFQTRCDSSPSILPFRCPRKGSTLSTISNFTTTTV